ncbi:MAG: MFS transporter [Candidatus Eremiobacteraeota bacterium]|nr:MFS transporter [Candidatus Eremiobacteraeota bacterium]
MSAPERTTFKELPPWNLRGLSVLSFAHGASDFFSGMVPLLIFSVVAGHGLSAAYQGTIGFLWYFTSSIIQPLFGMYSDTRGRWWFLPGGVLLTVVSVSLAGLASNIAVLALLIVIGGIGSAVMHPEAGKYSAMLSGARKAGGISIFQIGGAFGYALGPIAISRLLEHFGPGGSLAMLLPGLIACGILFITMARVDRAATRDHQPAESHERLAPTPVDHTGVALLVASTSLKYLVAAAFMTYLPNLIVARGGSIALAGEVVTLFLATGAIGLFAGGYLADRFGVYAISIASLAGAVPFLFAFFVVPGPLGFALLFVAGMLLNVQSAPGVAIVQRMLPKNLGMALGLMNGVAFGIGSAMVAGVGFIVARSGPSAALADVSALPIVCALAYVVVRFRDAREQPRIRLAS